MAPQKIQTSDGQAMKIDGEIIGKFSAVFRAMLEAIGSGSSSGDIGGPGSRSIVFETMDKHTWDLVMTWATHHANDTGAIPRAELAEKMSDFDKEFMGGLGRDELVVLLKAAIFLGIDELVLVCCQQTNLNARKKKIEEVRELLGLHPNDPNGISFEKLGITRENLKSFLSALKYFQMHEILKQILETQLFKMAEFWLLENKFIYSLCRPYMSKKSVDEAFTKWLVSGLDRGEHYSKVVQFIHLQESKIVENNDVDGGDDDEDTDQRDPKETIRVLREKIKEQEDKIHSLEVENERLNVQIKNQTEEKNQMINSLKATSDKCEMLESEVIAKAEAIDELTQKCNVMEQINSLLNNLLKSEAALRDELAKIKKHNEQILPNLTAYIALEAKGPEPGSSTGTPAEPQMKQDTTTSDSLSSSDPTQEGSQRPKRYSKKQATATTPGPGSSSSFDMKDQTGDAVAENNSATSTSAPSTSVQGLELDPVRGPTGSSAKTKPRLTRRKKSVSTTTGETKIPRKK